MPLPDSEKEVHASSEAAEIFVNNYYDALNRRQPLLPFYVNSTTRYSIPADISINGAQVATPADYYNLLEAQGAGVHYDVESFDTHVLNPSFQYNAPENIYDGNKAEKSGARMSIIVTVMGRVQYGKGKEAPQKMFNETFVLVPNWEALQRNPPRGVKRCLIMSQNFRAL
ncbi:hypothetical protein V2G26_016264 [Clonostachys chloroleuca]|uniref:NTF2 domain-containing protein n=1 Tax=Clonostachys chloroleuca TaxID=1926264 RepID=A0AA35MGZ4_9HYPO|nr:unnamed protein product [Clonostachys chloroleuca]